MLTQHPDTSLMFSTACYEQLKPPTLVMDVLPSYSTTKRPASEDNHHHHHPFISQLKTVQYHPKWSSCVAFKAPIVVTGKSDSLSLLPFKHLHPSPSHRVQPQRFAISLALLTHANQKLLFGSLPFDILASSSPNTAKAIGRCCA